jgi:hypothetical protein
VVIAFLLQREALAAYVRAGMGADVRAQQRGKRQRERVIFHFRAFPSGIPAPVQVGQGQRSG